MTTRKQADITIEGTRALLIHAFFIDALSAQKKEKTGSAGNDSEEWKRTIYIRKEDNQLFLPGAYFFSCICHGAKNIKSGKGSIQPKMASTLQIVDEQVLLNRYIPQNWELSQNPEELVYLDVRGVKNPSTKGRNARYRVALRKDWTCSLSVLWDSSVISVEQMHSSINEAGSFVGLGDARGIGYGRFKVIQFEHKRAQEFGPEKTGR